jgi:hypothetical protein
MKRLLVLLSLSLSLFAAGRDLRPRTVVPTAYDARMPRTAANDERFLTVWRESMGVLGTHIRGAFSDASGRRISPVAFTLVENVEPEWIEVTGTGDSFVVFWSRLGVTRMADVDREGRVSNIRTLDLSFHLNGRVAWNGTHLLGTFTFNVARESQAILFERDGDIVRRHHLGDPAHSFAIVPRRNGFIVASSGVHLLVHRITAAGATHQLIEGGSTPGIGSRPLEVVAASSPDGAFLVWSYGTYGPGTSDLHSVFARDDGTLSDVHVVARREGIMTPYALMRDGNDYVLAFTDEAQLHAPAKLRTMRLNAKGAMTGNINEGAQLSRPIGAATNGNVILIAANTGVQFTPRVSATVIGSSGVPSAAEMLSLTHTRQHQPALAAGNGRFLGMWTEHEGDAAYLRSTLLMPDGTPAQRPTAALSFLASRDLAWSGTDHLAVHRSGGKLMATRIDANGAPIDVEPIVLDTQDTYQWWETIAAVAWTGTRWMVIWPSREADRLLVAFVSPNGVSTAPRAIDLHRPQLPEGQFRLISDVAIAFDGTRALIVWNEALREICYFPICGDLGFSAFATHLNANGEALAAPIELQQHDRHSVAASTREFVIVAGNAATVIDNDELRIVRSVTLPGIVGLSDVTYDGRDYLVAVRYHVAKWYLRVHRINAELQGTVNGIATLAPDRFTAPSIAALDSRNVLVAIQEGDSATGARATVYREDELQALPAPPGTPVNVRVTRTADGYVTTWDAPPGSIVEQYYVEELSPEGFVWRATGVGPDVRQVMSPYRNVRIRARNAGGESAPTDVIPARRRAAGSR